MLPARMLPPPGTSDGTAGRSDSRRKPRPQRTKDGSLYPHLIYLVSDDDPQEVTRLSSALSENPTHLVKTFRSPEPGSVGAANGAGVSAADPVNKRCAR